MLRSLEPIKKICDESDLALFKTSVAYDRLLQILRFLAEKVRAVEVPTGFLSPEIVTRSEDMHEDDKAKLSQSPDDSKLSQSAQRVLHILDVFDNLLTDTPPFTTSLRFGNLACRDWHHKVEAESPKLVAELTRSNAIAAELNYYLTNAFGSEMRLDYGSGHELSFIAFIGGLFELRFFEASVTGAEVLAIFSKYYDLVRRLILVYNLEPAGSHGVWGLDDHFHFIYILGAAQFNLPKDDKSGHLSQFIPPVLQVLTPHTLNSLKLRNLYVNAIAFIFKIKLGPISEHSPMIFNIHKSVSLWKKVELGLMKMYFDEVLDKFPVVQHFWFGQSLYPWTSKFTKQTLSSSADRVKNAPKDDDSADDEPGWLNGAQGVKTTKQNISMTGAPWAMGDRLAKQRAANVPFKAALFKDPLADKARR